MMSCQSRVMDQLSNTAIPTATPFGMAKNNSNTNELLMTHKISFQMQSEPPTSTFPFVAQKLRLFPDQPFNP